MNETLKQDIHTGILSGIADAEAGRVTKYSLEYVDKLKAQLKTLWKNFSL